MHDIQLRLTSQPSDLRDLIQRANDLMHVAKANALPSTSPTASLFSLGL
jgi:hypothetical protein